MQGEIYLPISYVAEYAYCPRSSFLLLVDTPAYREDNYYMQDGKSEHTHLEHEKLIQRGSTQLISALKVKSEELRITGKLDYLKIISDGSYIPVEFKRGKKRESHAHQMQLALLALCLEEQFPENSVNEGEVYFTGSKEKISYLLNEDVKNEAKSICDYILRSLPNPEYFKRILNQKCTGCCFQNLCFEEDYELFNF